MVKVHGQDCGWHYGHDCDCGMIWDWHSQNCGYNYGHDCDCGYDEKHKPKK